MLKCMIFVNVYRILCIFVVTLCYLFDACEDYGKEGFLLTFMHNILVCNDFSYTQEPTLLF